jgi:2-keto-4-pentenoate hydratase/2-oxohepta-3-ene-1,7-dioic acid hydratase in catechol pathway
MKFVSFRAGGAARYGIVNGDGVVDLTSRLNYPDLRALIVAGAYEEAASAASGASAEYRLDQITYDPVIPNPGKIICIGLNYHEHREETGMTAPGRPNVFIRWPDTQIGHLADMIRPKASEQLDWEAELVIVIGKGGRNIALDQAESHIAGYSCYNEGSVRDYQRHGSQFIPGKNFPGTGAFGPFFATKDEVGPLAGKRIQTRLNGQIMQDATLDQMIYGPAQLIEYVSIFTQLAPGDIIVSGTPGGVGWVRKPPVWMKAGDIVEVEIDGVGLLRNTIADEK